MGRNIHQTKNDVISWQDVVEMTSDRSTTDQPLKVKVHSINELTDRDDCDVRVGDELEINDVITNEVRIFPASSNEGSNSQNLPPSPSRDFPSSSSESMNLPVTFGGKFKVLPLFPAHHVFGSVRDMLVVFPAIVDVIMPKFTFTVKRTQVNAWARLKVIDKITDSFHKEFLAVQIEMDGRLLLLPSELKQEFVQLDTSDCVIIRPIPRQYNLYELSNYWSPDNRPIRVQLAEGSNQARQDESSKQMTTMNRFLGNLGIRRKSETIETVKANDSSDAWMIPEPWRKQTLIIEPIQTVHVTNVNSGMEKLCLPASLDMQVVDINRTRSRPDVSRATGNDQRRASPPSLMLIAPVGGGVQLQDLPNVNSVELHSNRSDAIIAVVASDEGTATLARKQGPLSFGRLISIHQIKKVRKLLMSSPDSQHFLVSSQYDGTLARVPLVYESVSDVKQTGPEKYVTGCTSYPVQRTLDPCREGEIVQFNRKGDYRSPSGERMKVMHCLVSDTRDGPPHAVTYPLNLRGKFELLDQSLTMTSARELLEDKLPACVTVAEPDASLGFDPLKLKERLIVSEVLTETIATIQSVRAIDGVIIGSNDVMDVPTRRGSLLVQEYSPEGVEDFVQIAPFERIISFKKVQKLPSVELLTGRDVTKLRETSKDLASVPTDSQTTQSPLLPQSSFDDLPPSSSSPSTPRRPPKPPLYEMVIPKHLRQGASSGNNEPVFSLNSDVAPESSIVPQSPNSPTIQIVSESQPPLPREPLTPREFQTPTEPPLPREPLTPREFQTPTEPPLPREPLTPREFRTPTEPPLPRETLSPREFRTPTEPPLPREPLTPREFQTPTEPPLPREPLTPREFQTPTEPPLPREPLTPREFRTPTEPPLPREPLTPRDFRTPTEPPLPRESPTSIEPPMSPEVSSPRYLSMHRDPPTPRERLMSLELPTPREPLSPRRFRTMRIPPHKRPTVRMRRLSQEPQSTQAFPTLRKLPTPPETPTPPEPSTPKERPKLPKRALTKSNIKEESPSTQMIEEQAFHFRPGDISPTFPLSPQRKLELLPRQDTIYEMAEETAMTRGTATSPKRDVNTSSNEYYCSMRSTLTSPRSSFDESQKKMTSVDEDDENVKINRPLPPCPTSASKSRSLDNRPSHMTGISTNEDDEDQYVTLRRPPPPPTSAIESCSLYDHPSHVADSLANKDEEARYVTLHRPPPPPVSSIESFSFDNYSSHVTDVSTNEDDEERYVHHYRPPAPPSSTSESVSMDTWLNQGADDSTNLDDKDSRVSDCPAPPIPPTEIRSLENWFGHVASASSNEDDEDLYFKAHRSPAQPSSASESLSFNAWSRSFLAASASDDDEERYVRANHLPQPLTSESRSLNDRSGHMAGTLVHEDDEDTYITLQCDSDDVTYDVPTNRMEDEVYSRPSFPPRRQVQLEKTRPVYNAPDTVYDVPKAVYNAPETVYDVPKTIAPSRPPKPSVYKTLAD